MEITDLLSVSDVVDGLKAGSKKQALQELAAVAAARTAQDERAVLDVLLARERLGSTGVGAGVAIPHGKIAGLARPSAVFARLREPIEFDAIDERPVDLVLLLLAPDSAGADHLKALALVSRLLRDEHVCERLRGADSAEALYAVLAAAPGASRA